LHLGDSVPSGVRFREGPLGSELRTLYEPVSVLRESVNSQRMFGRTFRRRRTLRNNQLESVRAQSFTGSTNGCGAREFNFVGKDLYSVTGGGRGGRATVVMIVGRS
jgi:hypothetical protein